jgi:hypothetical protein
LAKLSSFDFDSDRKNHLGEVMAAAVEQWWFLAKDLSYRLPNRVFEADIGCCVRPHGHHEL